MRLPLLLWFLPVYVIAQDLSPDKKFLLPKAQRFVQFAINASQQVYLLEENRRNIAVYRLENDTLQRVESESLLLPGRDVLNIQDFVLHRQQFLYVWDEARQVLRIFNQDLKALSEIALGSLLPGGLDLGDFALGPVGEICFLNRFDRRIYVYDPLSRQLISFAGPDYGAGALFNPQVLDVETGGDFYLVYDAQDKVIKRYDRGGAYLDELVVSIDEAYDTYKISHPYFVAWKKNRLLLLHIYKGTALSYKLPEDETVLDVFIKSPYVYWLTDKHIYLATL